MKRDYQDVTNDADEVVEDDFAYAVISLPDIEQYGPLGSKQAAINWFRATQLHKLYDSSSGNIYPWFHGLIRRGWVAVSFLRTLCLIPI